MTTLIRTSNYIKTGSTVLNIRRTNDIDIICYQSDILVPTRGDEYIQSTVIDGVKYEFLLADNQKSLQYLLKNKNKYTPEEVYYILKGGHIHIGGRRQENWEKHMHDYSILKKIVDYPELINEVALHRDTTNKRVKQKTPKLIGVKKDEFFDDNVRKYIDHDLIHEEVAYDSVPAYSKMQKDETVQCHRDLWDKMEMTEKLQCVAEEASVIALERWRLPEELGDIQGKPMYLAYKWALYRICTTLCSGWFRQFALDNYYTVLNMFDENKLQTNLDNILQKIRENDKQTKRKLRRTQRNNRRTENWR